MTTYNTGNAIGSSDARDLYDNAQNIDNFANGSSPAYPDRFGVSRKSISGIESAFDTFIQSSGYAVPVAYASGIVLSEYNQLIEYDGEFYKLKAGESPFTTTGTWGTDSANLVSVGDAALRQELAADDGASKVSYLPAGAGAVATDVQSKLREFVSVKDFGAVGDGVTDDTAAFNNFLAAGGGFVPVGVYRITSTLQIPSYSRMIGVGFSFQQRVVNPIGSKPISLLLYDGPAVANSCVVNASRTAVGIRPESSIDETSTLKGVEVEGIVIDGNNKADIGFYTARSGLGNKFNNIYVTGTKKRGFFFGQFWTAAVKNLFAVYNYGTGFAIGENYFGWSDNIINAVLFQSLLAFKNGLDQDYDYETNGSSGVGYVIRTNKTCTFINLVAELNWGAGIVVDPRGGPTELSGLYLEDNCHFDVVADAASLTNTALALGRASHAWGLVYINSSGGTFSGPTYFKNIFGANINGNRPTGIKLTGNASGGFVLEPYKPLIFDGVIVVENIDSDFHNYEVRNSVLTGEVTTEPAFTKLRPYAGVAESVGGGLTTLWVGSAKTGNASGINNSNLMLLEDAVKVAKVCKDVTTINATGRTSQTTPASPLLLDGTGITRQVTFEGGAASRLVYSKASGNEAAVLSNWANLLLKDFFAIDRTKIQQSNVRFHNCPIIRSGANSAVTAAVIADASTVALTGTSCVDVNNSTAATKICVSLTNGSEFSFDAADALTLRNFTAGNAIHFNEGSGTVRISLTTVTATWGAAANVVRNAGGGAGMVLAPNGLNP